MSVKIAMIGTGYVGLVTGACFAALGHDVVCVDNDQSKVDKLKAGQMPIFEPGLDELVSTGVDAGRLRFTSDLRAGVAGREAVFIAVGTPTAKDSDEADLSHVLGAVAEVGAALDRSAVVVTKSTVPVGTNRRVAEVLSRHVKSGVKVTIASNPEFLREGAAIQDFMEPDRIVVGAEDPDAIRTLERIYEPLRDRPAPLLVTGIETAEIIKYAANAFLAVKVSFINEIADLCERTGSEVDLVSRGIGLDRRIGTAFLQAGPGWGGSCFPKDTRALRATATTFGVPSLIVDSAIRANDNRKRHMIGRIEAACGNSLTGKTIAVFGLTFKGGTDDMRESPSLVIVPGLSGRGAHVRAHDPLASHEAKRLLPGLELYEDPIEAARGAHALVVLTDWKVFRTYDLSKLCEVMAQPVLIDLRNMFDANVAREAGFEKYVGLGRPAKPLSGSLPRAVNDQGTEVPPAKPGKALA